MSQKPLPPRCRYCDDTGFFTILVGGQHDVGSYRKVRCTHRPRQSEGWSNER